MGMIGNFGSRIVFETSDRKILTFSGLSQKIFETQHYRAERPAGIYRTGEQKRVL